MVIQEIQTEISQGDLTVFELPQLKRIAIVKYLSIVKDLCSLELSDIDGGYVKWFRYRYSRRV